MMKQNLLKLTVLSVISVMSIGSSFALTKRISTASDGAQSVWWWSRMTVAPAISSDGVYAIFNSMATNLVSGDTNAKRDVFVKNTISNNIVRVSSSSSGGEWDWYSDASAITPDGRYIVFTSDSTNLVPGDTNARVDVFVKDRIAGTTTRASVSSTWAEGNNWSNYPSITPDGRYVLFFSYASNLVTGDTNSNWDIFVRDMVANTTLKINVSTAWVYGNDASAWASISNDGRYVSFYSNATNLVPGDTNAATDVFVRDTVAQTTTRISLGIAWVQGNGTSSTFGFWTPMNPGMSSDGRYVYFYSSATNIAPWDTNGVIDLFVRDTVTNTNIVVSSSSAWVLGNGLWLGAKISNDGRYVLFRSDATNLVPGDTNGQRDVFVKDIINWTTTLASVNTNGGQQSSLSEAIDMSDDGRYVLYKTSSEAFVRDTLNNVTIKAMVNNMGNQSATWTPVDISSDGTYTLFSSAWSNLVGGDTNGQEDMFVYSYVPCPIPYNNGAQNMSFCYSSWLQAQPPSTWSILLTFIGSWTRYNSLSPLVTVAKWPAFKSVSSIQAGAITTYRKIFRNQVAITQETEYTANWLPAKQLKFTWKIWGVEKVFIVTFIRSGWFVYVVSWNWYALYSNTLDDIVDTIVKTRSSY